MPEGTPPYLDTVALSNFALADRLDLLQTRYGPRALLTSEVLDEIGAGIAAGYEPLRQIEEAVAGGRLSMSPPLSAAERAEYRKLLRSLGSGEASCLVCARWRGGVVVTDDRAARSCCSEWGLTVTGTLGILKACCRDGSLLAEDADRILGIMVRAGFYSPVGRVGDLL